MKTILYHCDECKKEISENSFLELRTDQDEATISAMNTIVPEGLDRYLKNAHFCSKECFADYFFGKNKSDDEKGQSIKSEPSLIKNKRVKKAGWPKGKPRGSKADNTTEIEESEQSVLPARQNRTESQNDLFFDKLNFAKEIGFDSVAAAYGSLGKDDFEKRFRKSAFSNI